VNTIQSIKHYLHGAVIFLLTTQSLSAQHPVNLNRLIFEPVALEGAHAQTEYFSQAEVPVPDSAAVTDTPLSSIAAYQGNIDRLIAEHGSYTQKLFQDYFALGQSYQALNLHEKAIEAFTDANYISRINNGLATEATFELIRAEIDSHLALGDFSSANTRQQYLYYLGREVHGDDSLELVEVLSYLGDWQMTHFGSNILKRSVFSFSTGSFNNAPVSNPRLIAFGNLLQAQNYYFKAINNLLKHQELSDPALYELENKLIVAIFLGANRNGFLENPDFFLSGRRPITGTRILGNELGRLSTSFINGRNAYDRMHIYISRHKNTSALDIGRVMVAKADWFLLYGSHAPALKHYQQAYDYMKTNNVPLHSIDLLLAPELPIQLPAFTALPHSRAHFGIAANKQLEYAGYIDIRIEISCYGRAKNIEILGKSNIVPKSVVNRLKKLLHSSPFRPSFPENASDEKPAVRMRYYFAEVTDSQLASR